nr:hypothetical protein [Sphingomicrobium nitratireducens]
MSLVALASLTACGGGDRLEDGGVYTARSLCPQVGIPAGTGDVTSFSGNAASSANIDVVATLTNLRGSCSDTGADVISTATFDVLGQRRDAGPARTVTLPIFNVAMQGGTSVVAKRVGQVSLYFADGAVTAQAQGTSTIRVSRAAVTLPDNVRAELTRERKPGEVDAAIDPLTIPVVREAVARATFEHLVGFQLSDAQLRYNATR